MVRLSKEELKEKKESQKKSKPKELVIEDEQMQADSVLTIPRAVSKEEMFNIILDSISEINTKLDALIIALTKEK